MSMYKPYQSSLQLHYQVGFVHFMNHAACIMSNCVLRVRPPNTSILLTLFLLVDLYVYTIAYLFSIVLMMFETYGLLSRSQHIYGLLCTIIASHYLKFLNHCKGRLVVIFHIF